MEQGNGGDIWEEKEKKLRRPKRKGCNQIIIIKKKKRKKKIWIEDKTIWDTRIISEL